MGDRADIVVVREDGAHELYRTGWAVGLDLDLLDGPARFLALLPGLRRDGGWLDETRAQGGILVDLGRKALRYFVWEGPSAELRHRAAAYDLIRAAWPGWEVSRLYDGQAELRAYVGLDPEHVRRRDEAPDPAPFLAPDDEDVTGPDPGGVVVTVGTGRCYVASDAFDHPVHEGVGLLDRLAVAPGHGVCRLHAGSGIHIDPERRRLGWWSLSFTPGAYRVAERWPGWTVRFWQDAWPRHTAAAPLFAPEPFDPGEEARARVLAQAAERRAVRARHRVLVAEAGPGRNGSVSGDRTVRGG
ncbi:hypothetical protein [Streptomyces sp. NPDC048659]|uniref:hypothetical protein n=1 Tax=Streptomyces sp. NPDC048659 TaxID=3155489 RepID=UPI00343C2252